MSDSRQGAGRVVLPVTLLVLVTMLAPVSMQGVMPALPDIQRSLAVSVAEAQLIISLAFAAVALGTLLYGPLSDRFGRRPLLLIGLAMYTGGSLLAWQAEGLGTLVAARIVQAIGGASGLVLARAMVRDVHDREASARLIAYMTMAMVLAPMLAPALGGVLTDRFGWRVVFALLGALGALVLLASVVRLPETLRERAPALGLRRSVAGYGELLRLAEFRRHALQATFASALFFSFISAAPYIVVSIMGRPATEYGLFFVMLGCGYICGNFCTARLAERVGLERLIRVGTLVSLLGAGLMTALMLAGVWTPLALFAPAACMTFGNGLVIPNAQAGAMSVRQSAIGAAAGVTMCLQMGIGTLVAQSLGVLLDDTPLPLGMLLMAFATLGAWMAWRPGAPR